MYKIAVMSERFVPNVFTINFTNEQQEICKKCSATGFPINEPYKDKKLVCRPANLESILKRKPTYGETKGKKINMSSIPEDCPNRYKNVSILKIR